LERDQKQKGSTGTAKPSSPTTDDGTLDYLDDENSNEIRKLILKATDNNQVLLLEVELLRDAVIHRKLGYAEIADKIESIVTRIAMNGELLRRLQLNQDKV